MKALDDKLVRDDLWHVVLGYIVENDYKPVFDRKLEKYDERNRPMFKMEWLSYEQYKELLNEAVKYFLDGSLDITEETLENFLENDSTFI